MLLVAMILMIATPDANEAPKSLERPGALKTHPATWVTMGDYPVSARRARREGVVEFIVRYGPNGSPTGCDIFSSSGYADLDEMTCRLVKARARFKPGRNSRGEVVGGTYRNTVRWHLPAAR